MLCVCVQREPKHEPIIPQLVSPCPSTLATSDVSRRKWLIPGAEYSIFTGQPLDAPDNRMDDQLVETCAPG